MPDQSGNQTADVQDTPLHAYGDGREGEADAGSRGITGDQGQGKDEATYQDGGHEGDTKFGGVPAAGGDANAEGADAGIGAGAMDPGGNDNDPINDPESPARAEASRPPRGAPVN